MTVADVFVGKEMLRLVTTAMYDSPLVVYREYVQNSVDAFDSSTNGFAKDSAEIHINIDRAKRCVTVRDNGPGVTARKFSRRMKSIGWSEKTGSRLRGIWGIGRLSGLAYCKHLVFRTKAHGENKVSRIDWDGQKFRELLSAPNQNVDLPAVIEQIATTSSEKADAGQPGFFEVQINEIVRNYLAQVAPVPFHDAAPFGKNIRKFLMPHVDVSGYRIYLNENASPIFKPHQKEILCSSKHTDQFSDHENFVVKSPADKPAAVGWILHHSYFGALKNNPEIRGIRVRSGNMQIGDERILSGIFPEERFNSWSVGEVHLLDPMLRPNGQRSNLEDTPAFRNIKNQLTPIIGRNIAKKCRDNSAVRNQVRRALEQLTAFGASMDMLESSVLSSKKTKEILADIEFAVAGFQSGPMHQQTQILEAAEKISARVKKMQNGGGKQLRSGDLSGPQLQTVNEIADLIYDHLPNPKVASDLMLQIRSLVERKRK